MENIIRWRHYLLCIGLTACQPTFIPEKESINPIEVQTIQTTGYQLTLVQTQDICLLQAKKQAILETYPLTLTTPCFFISDDDAVHIETYPDWNIQAVIIMAGDTLSPTRRTKWGIKHKEHCGDQIQAIIIQHGQIQLTDRIDKTAVCQRDDLDEKAFRNFVYNN